MTTIPCLQPAELLAFTVAEQRSAVRGVDCGPNTTVTLLDTIRRLARVVASVEHAAQQAHHTGAELDPAVIYALVGGGTTSEAGEDEQWQWGVRWVSKTGAEPEFVSEYTTELGARTMVRDCSDPKDWNPHAVGVMRRRVSEWQAAPDAG